MISLHHRLLIAASLVLTVFLGVTGLILDSAFHESAETAVRDRLQGNLYALIAAADLDEENVLQITRQLPESRFATPHSGLYARIVNPRSDAGEDADPGDGVVFQSRSVLDLALPVLTPADIGVVTFGRYLSEDQAPYFAVTMRLAWELDGSSRKEYVFQVIEDLQGFRSQVTSFRTSLWGWLAGVSLVLLAVQGTILRWSLSPLRTMSTELENIKTGKTSTLGEEYPRELEEVSSSINSFIEHERSQRDRYRDTLGDLAHSLKTPLAVVRGAVEGGNVDMVLRAEMQEQVDRMRQIVDYQLQRAATSGRTALSAPISVAGVAQRIVSSLDKVFAEKGVVCEFNVADDVLFFGDEGDLMEVLGNLLENAYKWASGQVRISASNQNAGVPGEASLELLIEDDGPGIAADEFDRLLQRGERADDEVKGYGIGLAVVRDVMQIYAASFTMVEGSLGGACFRLVFPARSK